MRFVGLVLGLGDRRWVSGDDASVTWRSEEAILLVCGLIFCVCEEMGFPIMGRRIAKK